MAEALEFSLSTYKKMMREEKSMDGRGKDYMRPEKDSDCGNWIDARIMKRCLIGATINSDNQMYTLLTNLMRHHETGDSEAQSKRK